MLDDKELKAIDDWRFDNRIPSRAAAIRELIRRGMVAQELPPPKTDDKTSADFAIVNPEAEPKTE